MWDFVGIVRSLDLILSIKESHWTVSKKKKKKRPRHKFCSLKILEHKGLQVVGLEEGKPGRSPLMSMWR